MNYEQLSDQEINQRVTAITCGCSSWELSSNGTHFYRCGVDGSEYHIQSVIDYCNRPEEAWSIIIIIKTSLFLDGVKWQAVHPCYAVARDDNPLRAAMIMFLKMNEEADGL